MTSLPQNVGHKIGLAALICGGVADVALLLLFEFGRRLTVIQNTHVLSSGILVDHGKHWLPWVFGGVFVLAAVPGLVCGILATRRPPARIHGIIGIMMTGLPLLVLGVMVLSDLRVI
jgi:hypothetical protein